MLPSADLREDI